MNKLLLAAFLCGIHTTFANVSANSVFDKQKELFSILGSVGQSKDSQHAAINNVAQLFAQGVAPFVKDKDQRTPLMFAVHAHSFPLVYLLLAYNYKRTYALLSDAARAKNNNYVVENALKAFGSEEKGILINAIKLNQKYIPQDFVNAQDSQGMTALMFAALYGYTHIVQALLAAGAHVDIKNKAGKTAAELVDDSRSELLDLLNGGDVMHQNKGISSIDTRGTSPVDRKGVQHVPQQGTPFIRK